MLEIFVPIRIKEKIFINNFSLKLEKLIKNNFVCKIEKINTKIFLWVYFLFEELDKDFIILANWEFWEFYFLDYDFLKIKNIDSFWTFFLRINSLEKKLDNIWKDIDFIIKTLKSDKLLTNSKKDEIITKINKNFFILSGILFVLEKNKKLLEKNKKDLKNYSWNIEYESQAKLLLEISKTKSLELNLSIEKFENMVLEYLKVLENIL